MPYLITKHFKYFKDGELEDARPGDIIEPADIPDFEFFNKKYKFAKECPKTKSK
jgi:hypothetical protein